MTDVVGEAPAGAVVSPAALARRFPVGFTWGVATSAYQIEGAATAADRGPSIWDTFSRQPGAVANGDTADVACDHYNRWRDDVALMAELGVGSYRFSVSWPRVLPLGVGEPNVRGLDFYERLVDGLLAAGIRPMPTLYHWDLPQALQDRGGWNSAEVVGWFADYAALLARRLGDRVREWMTINEPQVFAFTGHATGKHAPGARDWGVALRVADHALRAHAAAAGAIRAAVPMGRIGLALDVNDSVPASDSDEDVAAAERWRATRHRWFLDPLFGRGYPEPGLAAHRAAGHLNGIELAEPPPGQLDFVGLNYYARECVAANRDHLFGSRVEPPVGSELTAMGWQVHPDGLRDVLLWLHREYAPESLVVSENGAAYGDELGPDGRVADGDRERYLAHHIAAAGDAIAAGVPLTGYYAWSLLDNFEWSEGYGRRFGLVHVDYATQRRTVKQSGRWYQALLASAA